jgi:site-specific DNA-methyltransferase (adenine-specific)
MTFRILEGDNRDVLKTIADNTIDAIVTDPPYGIDFLGKDWDANTGALETYQECLRVLKPGGYILAFSAARTYHHLAVTVETAGFEIRDQIMWIYGSGFPKSQDIGRQLHKKHKGKPDKQRFDPSIMIKVDCDQYRHPTNGKLYRALPDINGDRLAVSHEGTKYGTVYEEVIEVDSEWSGWGTSLKPAHEPIVLARKPTKLSFAKNVETWGTGALNINATRIGNFIPTQPSTGTNVIHRELEGSDESNAIDGIPNTVGRFPSNVIGEFPDDIQKYFYCPKVSRKERHVGFDSADTTGNNHPTVKPIALMEYLIKLVTPAGGLVLDPFNGSGSTGMAAVELGCEYIGIELDPNYVKIAETRISAWQTRDQADNTFEELFEEEDLPCAE